MKGHHCSFMYVTASVLCFIGIILSIVGNTWNDQGSVFAQPGGKTTATPPVTLSTITNLGISSTNDNDIITKNTNVFWITDYSKGGKEVVVEDKADDSVIGDNYTQFAEIYPDYTLQDSDGRLCMVQTYDQYSPDYYIIQSDDNGDICVYRNLEGKDKLSEVMKLSLTINDVPKDYIPLIKEGMAFNSIEGIEGLIESAET